MIQVNMTRTLKSPNGSSAEKSLRLELDEIVSSECLGGVVASLHTFVSASLC